MNIHQNRRQFIASSAAFAGAIAGGAQGHQSQVRPGSKQISADGRLLNIGSPSVFSASGLNSKPRSKRVGTINHNQW